MYATYKIPFVLSMQIRLSHYVGTLRICYVCIVRFPEMRVRLLELQNFGVFRELNVKEQGTVKNETG
jgi:hypothetical protein